MIPLPGKGNLLLRIPQNSPKAIKKKEREKYVQVLKVLYKKKLRETVAKVVLQFLTTSC